MSSLLPQLMAWYPNKKLYKGQSCLSKKPLITIYPDGSYFKKATPKMIVDFDTYLQTIH